MDEEQLIDKKGRVDLAISRINWAKELLDDAKDMIEKGSYRSANNRAFYSMEKSVKSLLALRGMDCKSHDALLKLFHNEFVFKDNLFTRDENKMLVNANTIRNNSDYDDFYICNKADCAKQVKSAEYFYNKCSLYVQEMIKQGGEGGDDGDQDGTGSLSTPDDKTEACDEFGDR